MYNVIKKGLIVASYISQVYFGITKNQQAKTHDGQDAGHFSDIFKHQNALSKQYKIARLGIEKEGTHCKCNVLFLGFFALVAAAGAVWLFAYHCQDGGLIPALCLCTISIGFVVAIAITSVLSSKHQKSLEHQFETHIQGHVQCEEILQAMEKPQVTVNTIKTVVGGLKPNQRSEFIKATYCANPKELVPAKQKVLEALATDPELISLIEEKGSGFALTMLRYSDSQSPDELLECLIHTINLLNASKETIHTFIALINDKGRTFALRVFPYVEGSRYSSLLFDGFMRLIKDPQSPEEAAQLAHHPFAILNYAHSLAQPEQTLYKHAFLRYTLADTPDSLIPRLLDLPQSEDEALTFARHPCAVAAKAKENRRFALWMLNLLPPDYDLDLLAKLMPSVTTKSAAQIIRRHPKACSHLISELTSLGEKTAADMCSLLTTQEVLSPDKTGVYPIEDRYPHYTADVPSFAYFLTHASFESFKFFTLKKIHGYFSCMKSNEQNLFLQELYDACTDYEACARSDAIVSYIMQHSLTQNIVDLRHRCPSFVEELIRWPKSIAEYIFGSDFEGDGSQIYNSRFFRCLLSEMLPSDQNIFAQYAAVGLNRRPDIANIYTKWLVQQGCPSIFSAIMANSPEVLAQVLCCIERPEELDLIEKMNHAAKSIATMTGQQKSLFNQKYLALFLPKYEKMIVDHYVVSKELDRQLLIYIRFMDTDSAEPELLSRLMSKHPALFTPIQVACNGINTTLPAFRLIKLSPVFERMLNSDMKESQNRMIELKDPYDVEVARSFIHYLQWGLTEEGEENILALAHLAQCYEINHLSNLCTQLIEATLKNNNYLEAILKLDKFYQKPIKLQMVEANLNLINYLEIVLEAAVKYQLWDIRLVCIGFISKNSRGITFSDLAKNRRWDDPVKQFLEFGLNCKNQGIAVSYSNSSKNVKKTKQFGLYRAFEKPKRCVKLEKFISIEDLDKLNQLILPEDWSVGSHVLGNQFVQSALQADRQDFLAIFSQASDFDEIKYNSIPAAHLKGSKSLVKEGVQFNVQGDSKEITLKTLKDSPFKFITLDIKVTGDKEQTLFISVPENLKGTGLKKIIARNWGITDLAIIDLKHEGYPLDRGLSLNDSGIEEGTELTLDLSKDKSMTTLTNEKITDNILDIFVFKWDNTGYSLKFELISLADT